MEHFFPRDSDDVAPCFYEFPSAYRSVSILPPSPRVEIVSPVFSELHESSGAVLSRPQLSKGTSHLSPSSSGSRHFLGSTESSPILPALPSKLMRSHFEVNLMSDDIISQISSALTETPGISFELNMDKYEWMAVYLDQARVCKFQLNLYRTKSINVMVEGNRLSGDHSLFRSVFDRLKFKLTPVSLPRDLDSFALAKHTFGPESVSEENVITAFEPILRMAKDPKMESQMEASRIICENSIDENIQQLLCDHGFLETLRDLATSSSSDWAKQHAVAAVANLSDNSACQEPIIASGLLPVVLDLCKNGTFVDTEMHRLAAHTLANVSRRAPEKVVQKLGVETLRTWISTVDDMNDERLKLQSGLAKEALSMAVC